MGEPASKRRKWDVAAPQGLPVTNTRAGIGSAGVTGIGHPAYGGPPLDHLPTGTSLIPAGSQPAAAAVPVVTFAAAPAPVPDAGNKPLDGDTIKRIQQSALDVVARLNQVCVCVCVRAMVRTAQAGV